MRHDGRASSARRSPRAPGREASSRPEALRPLRPLLDALRIGAHLRDLPDSVLLGLLGRRPSVHHVHRVGARGGLRQRLLGPVHTEREPGVRLALAQLRVGRVAPPPVLGSRVGVQGIGGEGVRVSGRRAGGGEPGQEAGADLRAVFTGAGDVVAAATAQEVVGLPAGGLEVALELVALGRSQVAPVPILAIGIRTRPPTDTFTGTAAVRAMPRELRSLLGRWQHPAPCG